MHAADVVLHLRFGGITSDADSAIVGVTFTEKTITINTRFHYIIAEAVAIKAPAVFNHIEQVRDSAHNVIAANTPLILHPYTIRVERSKA
jgi:hypothetical protein